MYKQPPIHVFNFGKVIIGKVYKKTFTPSRLIEIESISLAPMGNPLAIQFEAKIHPNRTHIIVTFTPDRPNQSCCDYYVVTNNDKTVYYLNPKGETEDIEIEVNKKVLTLLIQPGGRCKQYLKITNKSKTPGVFQFMLDDGCITVEPARGMVNPLEYVWIQVIFQSDKVTLWKKELYCLIQYHAPIVIKVRAACFNKIKNREEIHRYINFVEELWHGKDSYEQMFQEETWECGQKRGLIPVTLSVRYLDLGHVTYSPDREISSVAFFTLTCNTPVNIKLRWSQDPKGEFKISPKSVTIRKGDVIEYQVTYTPKSRDKFSHVVLSPTIFWGNGFYDVLPFYTNINLLGNSFDKKVCGWTPEYSIIPKVIRMPPAIPNFKVYCTMAIKNCSNIPIMFKLIPTKNSPFEIFPMQGVIDEGFQLFVVKMSTGSEPHTLRKDRWTIKLNTSFSAILELQGTVELPNLNFLNSSDIVLPPTNLGCYSDASIYMINPTRLDLKFKVELKTFEKNLINKNEDVQGIYSNEMVWSGVVFCPQMLGECRTSIYICPFLINPNGEILQEKTLISITGFGVEPCLSVTPQTLTYGDTPLGSASVKSFVMKNTGSSIVHVALSYISRYSKGNIVRGEVNLEPSNLTLMPMDFRRILVTLITEEPGFQELVVIATVLRSKEDNYPVQEVNIVEITYMVVFPKLKILDILPSDENHIMSRYFSWFFLNIDELNRALAEMSLVKDQQVVLLKVPEGEIKSKPMFYKFLIQNVGNASCKFSFKSLLKCKCPKEQRKYCGHEDVEFSTAKNTLDAKEITEVKLEVQYTSDAIERYHFILSLGSIEKQDVFSLRLEVERYVINVNKLSGDFPLPSENGVIRYSVFPVGLGELDPPYQALWVYNNTRAETNYDIKVNEKDSRFLRLVNPRGTIRGKTFIPIIVKFSPYELKEYHLTLDVTMGSKKFDVLVYGSGVGCDKKIIMNTLPHDSLFEEPLFPVVISVSHLNVKRISTHSFKKYFVTLKNTSNKKIKFSWSKFVIGGLVSTTVEPRFGELFPNEIVACLVCVRTYSYPVMITCSLHCKLIDAEQVMAWMEHRKRFEQLTKEFENVFMISGPQGNILHMGLTENLKEPEPFFQALTISVNCKTCYPCKNTDVPPLAISNRYNIGKPIKISPDLMLLSSGVLQDALWEILNDKTFLEEVSQGNQDIHYPDLLSPIKKSPLKMHMPKRCISSLIDDTFYSIVCEMFQLNPFLESNYNGLFPRGSRRKAHNTKCTTIESLNNKYFHDVLAEANTKHSVFKPRRLASHEVEQQKEILSNGGMELWS